MRPDFAVKVEYLLSYSCSLTWLQRSRVAKAYETLARCSLTSRRLRGRAVRPYIHTCGSYVRAILIGTPLQELFSL